MYADGSYLTSARGSDGKYRAKANPVQPWAILLWIISSIAATAARSAVRELAHGTPFRPLGGEPWRRAPIRNFQYSLRGDLWTRIFVAVTQRR
jgi:hypothetical protein